MSALINAMVHALFAILGDAVPIARTATFTSTGFDTQDYEGNLGILQVVGAAAGTSTTLDGTIETSADNSSFAAISGAAFATVTDAGDNQVQKLIIDLNGCKRYIRYVGTIGGGANPSFTYGVLIGGVKKYV